MLGKQHDLSVIDPVPPVRNGICEKEDKLMKKTRNCKWLCSVLALVLVLSVVPSAIVTADAVGAFYDVPDGAWFAQPVAWALQNSITTGTTATTFSPNGTCTRAEILTFLWRAAGSPQTMSYNPYYDVTAADYYYSAAIWAAENDLIYGELFAGAVPCTRSDVVTYLWKLSGAPYAVPAAFTDVPQTASCAQAVSWAVDHGITTGTGATTFTPQGVCTRGEIVTFLYRAFGSAVVQKPQPPSGSSPVPGERVDPGAVADVLYGLRASYPEGTFWSIDSSYHSEALQLTYAGCAGFALMCSDMAFGDLPISEVHSDYDRIRVGDMVRDINGYHTVIVLEKRADSIVVVEGNYNDSVHWERVMTRTDPEFYNFTVTTRYP